MLARLYKLGRDLSATLNTLVFGRRHQTFSASAALARNEGKAWGCVVCAILKVVFRPFHKDHCDWSLEP